MTKIEQIKAEIERRIAILDKELKPAASEDFISSWASTANNKRVTLQSILSFIDSLEKEQLKGLDEAAEDYMQEMIDTGEDYRSESDEPLFYAEAMKPAFKAGVEWMTGQGVWAEGDVCILTNRAWITPDKSLEQKVLDNFCAGDKVIVQIRKKED